VGNKTNHRKRANRSDRLKADDGTWRAARPTVACTDKPEGRVIMYPTFVATFANGQTTRMSIFTTQKTPDFARGVRLFRAAMMLRVSLHPKLLEGSGVITPIWSELDGKKIATAPRSVLGAAS
jgi:hypothetical protein